MDSDVKNILDGYLTEFNKLEDLSLITKMFSIEIEELCDYFFKGFNKKIKNYYRINIIEYSNDVISASLKIEPKDNFWALDIWEDGMLFRRDSNGLYSAIDMSTKL